MIEILQFYVSGFWVWAGLTIGLGLVLGVLTQFLVILTALTMRRK